MYLANGITLIFQIIDETIFTQIKRYLKQAIVDKNYVVSSHLLASFLHVS